MSELRILSASEQVASHMREQISRRIWTGTMPGGGRLSRELGVGRMTVESALAILEAEGLLETQGIGKRRRIAPLNDLSTPNLRVAILLYAPDDSKIYYNVDMQHRLLNAGHFASFTSKTLVELGMDPKRIARFVESTPADAWVVSSGSREVLEWFAEHRLPTFAFAGRRHQVRIASTGPDKEAALRSMVQRLVDLGHRSIVMLAQAVRCKPEPGRFEQLFLDELAAHGIKYSSFNLPDWKESAEGLEEVLDNLFRYTSPTALIIQETHTFIAVQQHLAQRGILAPRDVSLISDEPASLFTWCRPTVAHINWDGGQIARRAVRWANNVARGKDDRRCSFIKSEFVDGGTLGPVPKGRAETKVVAPLTKSP
jgi:DNA-binding LacI/PurR family transcriptional regulator/DNA-binding transcriptional ArsR family regulator